MSLLEVLTPSGPMLSPDFILSCGHVKQPAQGCHGYLDLLPAQHPWGNSALQTPRGTSSLGENVTLFSSPISFLDTCWHQQTSLIRRTFLLDGRWWVWYRNLSCGNGCHSPVEIIVCILQHVSNSWKDAENCNLEQLKWLSWLLGTIFLPPRAIAAFKAPCSEKTIRKRWFSLSVGVLWVAGDISLTWELLPREGSWCCHL